LSNPEKTAEIISAFLGLVFGIAVVVLLQAYLLTLILPIFALQLTFGQSVLVCLFLYLVIK
jgi:hypothetical protein